MLKKFRYLIAIISLLAVTMLFTDFTGTASGYFGWLAKIQFVPALISLNLIALAVIMVMTLLFGRIYCSVICPMGIFQDVISWIKRHIGPKSKRYNPYTYQKAATITRISMLMLFAALFITGFTHIVSASIAGLLDPYSGYGRISTSFFAPVWDWVNNILAERSAENASYTFYAISRQTSTILTVVASVTALVVILFAWFTGRGYCNKICPVGTILGYLSQLSILRPVIDNTKCIGCRKCAHNCKASCIDPDTHTIDYTRCVTCFDCINNCKENAISYTFSHQSPKKTILKEDNIKKSPEKGHPDTGRRNFLAIGGVIASAIAINAAEKPYGSVVTTLKDKKRPIRKTPLAPPGALSIENFTNHCTACQLCITSCPNSVLSTSTDFSTFMQPRMDFSMGYCRPECNICSSVCPSGAIKPIDLATKSSTKVGRAVVNTSICISATGETSCGNCARHCPASAILMVHTIHGDSSSPLRPAVDESRCIGCGSCEYHCPVGNVAAIKSDYPAIHVEGIEIHHTI